MKPVVGTTKQCLIIICVMLMTTCLFYSPASSSESIVMFGDSITAGWPYRRSNGNGCTDCGGYQYTLQYYLDTSGRDAMVYNWGVPGELSSSGVSRIGTVLSFTPANYVLIQEGTNDLLFYIDAATVAYNVYNMASKVISSGGIPIVGTLLPDSTRGAGYDWKGIALANAYIKFYVQSDSRVCLSTQHDAISDLWDAGYSYEGLHPNSWGYFIMGQQWYQDLSELKDCSY
ncbi:MAG: hypothetical protein CSA20_00915 [Deltaproteobacteria bacterium]|nr:MAG: hypothetical protein CSA20_00915 [Deltaproteobacteria bacterium]